MSDFVGSSPLRALLVEDSEEDAELIEEALRDAGLAVQSRRVDTAGELSQALTEETWDIILTDYNLPHFDGSTTMAIVRASGLDTPVILISGTIGEERAVEALKAGASDYLLKDSFTRLPHAIGRALREVQEQRGNRDSQERARQLAAIVESSNDSVISIELDGTILSWNRSAERLYGYAAADAIGRKIDMLAPPDKHGEDSDIVGIASGASREQVETLRVRKDGEVVTVSLTVSPVYDPSGTLVGASSISRDITTLKRAERLTRESDQRYRSAVESSLDGILTTDLSGVVTFANQRLADLLMHDKPAALIGRDAVAMVADEDREKAATMMHVLLERGVDGNIRCAVVRSDGSLLPTEMSASLLRDETGAASGTTATIRDAADRVAYEEQLKHLALHDVLTGLPNRTLFHDRLEQALLRRSGTDAPVSVLLIDLDQFKMVNDTFGHHSGDELLKEVSRRIQSNVRASDTVGRAGGDEYLVVLPGADSTQALVVAGTILNALNAPLSLDGHQIVVGASVGIANRPQHSEDLSALMRFADIAMYRAKREKTGCAIYTSADDSTTIEAFLLVRDLREAIPRGELLMNYQPQVDLRTGRVQRVEALVRWQHPERGLIPPNQFINLAERTGLMKSVTEWVVGEAARQSAEWHARGVEIVVTVNLSAENLRDPDLLPMIRDSLSAHGADPTSFGVEITETSIMRQPDHALRIIQELNDLGVRIAIDDFGTGYSSLGYLKRFPAHELKIDRSFVKDMREDGNDAIIVGAIIDLGHKLGLDVLAEGVEDEETLNSLLVAGCDLIQGYYFSRPLSAIDIEEWLRYPPSQVTTAESFREAASV